MESYATAQQVFAAGLVFARLGAIVMLIPGLGEAFIPPRIRLAFALSLALMMFPLVARAAPALPADAAGMALAVIKELLIGLLIGGILRMFMTSLAAAGEIVSLQTTLSFAQTANPMQAQPSTTLGTFLGLIGVVLIFTTDLHHLFIAAIVRSYDLFPFTRTIPLADAGQLAVQTMGKSFALGVQLAAPVIVFSLIFNMSLGLVARLLPQIQIFMIAMPASVLLGLAVLALSLGGGMTVWLTEMQRQTTFLMR